RARDKLSHALLLGLGNWVEVGDDLAHKRRHLVCRDVTVELAAGQQAADDGRDRARHPHAVAERDRRVAEEAPKALLEILVLGAMALVVLELLEGPLVALVEAEEVAVREHLVDELVEERGPRRDDLALVREAVELVENAAPELVQAQVELEQDVFLALEVVIERRLRDAEALGDLAQRGPLVPLLVEQLERDVQDPLACRAAGPLRADLAHTRNFT